MQPANDRMMKCPACHYPASEVNIRRSVGRYAAEQKRSVLEAAIERVEGWKRKGADRTASDIIIGEVIDTVADDLRALLAELDAEESA